MVVHKPVSNGLSAVKVGKLVTECQPNASVEASKFIFGHIWALESEHFQTYWIRYGLESEQRAEKFCAEYLTKFIPDASVQGYLLSSF